MTDTTTTSGSHVDLTDAEREADLDLQQLKQLVGLVDYDESRDPFPVTGWDAVVFVVGNALTFVLEGVVAGVQALRLEYYELFSRVFVSEGRPFRPWFVPTAASDAASRGSALEGST